VLAEAGERNASEGEEEEERWWVVMETVQVCTTHRKIAATRNCRVSNGLEEEALLAVFGVGDAGGAAAPDMMIFSFYVLHFRFRALWILFDFFFTVAGGQGSERSWHGYEDDFLISSAAFGREKTFSE